ncbi:phage minor head protein [Pseudomonas alabamensis]|uniref:phage minor head protein n=1 Tax=Pseudomonas alabamensis TaxID=3064349 RepID=UPI0011A3F189
MKASEVEAEIQKLEPGAQQAYLDQVATVARSVSISELEQAINDGDESRLQEILALGLFALFVERLRAAYASAAARELVAVQIPGVRREIDMGADSVTSFLAGQARALREQAERDQMDAARTAITQGRLRGESARTIALNIAGRLSRQTGKRTGGLLGLTGSAADAIERAREQLASADSRLLRDYLRRERRDRRFDIVVQGAIEKGKPLPKDTRERAVAAYAKRLLAMQAEALAQTNIAEAYNKAREEGWKQLTARSNGLYTYVKTWRSMRDGTVRHTHAALHGTTVRADQPFTSISGAQMMFPCDPSLGAPLSERMRCRCVAEYTLRKIEQAV